MRNRHPKKIKFFLVSVIVVTVGIIVAIFLGYRKFADSPAMLLATLGDKADASLGSIHHTATRNGVKEWTLEAKSARLIGAEKHMVLKELSVVYYTRDGKEVYLTADEGTLNTESNDIEVTGNVVLITEPYELRAKKLNYVHKRQRIYSKEPVRIISTTSYLGANAMSFNLKNSKARFVGNVEGIFAENMEL